MTTVSSVTSSATATTTTTAESAQETEDRFLKLLVASLENQDPLNPMDNAEITSQMAQLSTVTELGKLNDTANAMSASYLSGQSLQAASLIGHGVMIPGSALELSGGVAYGGVEIPQAVDSLTVTVKDASGAVIHTAEMGAQDAAGSIPFVWDGTTDSGAVAPDGSYSFEVTAKQGGEDIAVTALAVGQVVSVSLGALGATLNVAGLGEVAVSEVKQIL